MANLYLPFDQVITYPHLKSLLHLSSAQCFFPLWLKTGSMLSPGLRHNFQFQRNTHLLKALWHADIHSIVLFLTELPIMKLFSERKFSRVGKQLNRTFLHLNTRIQASFFVAVILSWVRKTVRSLSSGFRCNAFLFTKRNVPAKYTRLWTR